jgi:HEPN domain-containing protein
MSRNVDRNRWKVFLAKAEEFLRGAQHSKEQRDWNASVSNAVHAGILACDVVTVGLLGVRNTGEHDDVAQLLNRALPSETKDAADMKRRVRRLLQVKNLAEYEDRSAQPADAEACLKDADRLVAFARHLAKEL